MSKGPNASFLSRVFLAYAAFWRILTSVAIADRVREAITHAPALPASVPEPKPEPEPEPEPEHEPEPEPEPMTRVSTDAALQLLGLLQREGCLIDFLEGDVSDFDDADVGAAARVVHEGCRKALKGHLEVEPIRAEEEGSAVEVPTDHDPRLVRLTGAVGGEGPYRGELVHRGWKVSHIELPKLADEHDPSVLAPAEVELS